MPDHREAELDYLESQIPSLSAAATDVAYWQALAAGQRVLISDEGGVYQISADGSRTLIKPASPRLRVPIGTRVRVP